MIANCSCEVCIFNHAAETDFSTLSIIPTVCLIAVRDFGDEFKALILKCLSIGTTHFASYGEMASITEDEIDIILEDGVDDWLDVATTAHENDSLEDIVHFLIGPACVDGGVFRFLIVCDSQVLDATAVLKEVKHHCPKITRTSLG